MNSTVTLIEVNSETSTCECCGRTDLKRVAVLRLTNGSVVRYGCDCAGRTLGKGVAKSIKAEVARQQRFAEAVAYIEKWENEGRDSSKIANVVNVKYAGCWFTGKVYQIDGVNYTPMNRRVTVSWWAA